MTLRIDCPLTACPWSYEEEDSLIAFDAMADQFGYGVMAAIATNSRNQRIEDTLAAHFTTHKTHEWVAEITALRTELKRLKELFP